jgi:putative transposase
MNVWLVGNGIPQRTSCANCAAPMSSAQKARLARRSLPNLVSRRRRCTTGGAPTIPAELLVAELKKVFVAAGGPPKVLRMDNGPEFISQALQQFCDRTVRMSYIPPGTPWNNGHIESFNNRLRKECLNGNHWNTLFEARVVIGDFKHEHNHRHRHSALGYRTPAEYAAACRCTHTPVACEIN